MGKNIIAQARGKGGPTYRAPSFRYKGEIKHKKLDLNQQMNGTIVDIVSCGGHSSPLALVKYEDEKEDYILAPEGVAIGDTITISNGVSIDPKEGNVLCLKDIPEGSIINNIESIPGDGGKFVRASGTFAKVVSKHKDRVIVLLPSKKQKIFHPMCRATIGVIAGGGRTDKPFVKAGNKFYAMRARNKLYPKVSGSAMNAVDHPFGNKRTLRKSHAKPVSRHAPPGRKVGSIAARRTGRKKR